MIACFFELQEQCFDEIEEYLKKKGVQYAIAFENTPKDHFHLLFDGEIKIYNSLSKYLCDKYKLRRTGKGGKIKYGKVNNIKDIGRMLAYTIKDGNFRTNMDQDKVKEAIETSFKKETKFTDIKDDIVTYLDDNPYPWAIISTQDKPYDYKFKEYTQKMIIEWHLDKDIVLKSVSSVKSYYIYYLQKSKALSKGTKINMLINLI